MPGLADVRRVLYRLPNVVAQSRAGGLVFLVEGEKTVEGIERLGLTATTSPMGAGKWDDTYSWFLVGATVVVAPDCDIAGRRHMVTAAASLLTRHVPVRGPLDLDAGRHDGHDLHDHLAEQAAALRSHDPSLEVEQVRHLLRDHLLRLVDGCAWLTLDALSEYRELANHRANPDGAKLLVCGRCGRERPHVIRAGVAYCPCGQAMVP